LELARNFNEVLKEWLSEQDYSNAIDKAKNSIKVLAEGRLIPEIEETEIGGGFLGGDALSNLQRIIDTPAIIDLSKQAVENAAISNKQNLIPKFQRYQEQAEKIVTEQQLMTRFNEYQIAATDILGSQNAIAKFAENADKENYINESENVKPFFRRIKDILTSAFDRLSYYLIGVKDNISEKVQDLINSLGGKIKDKVHIFLDKISGILNSISKFFSTVLVKMIEWASTIKRIGNQKGFILKTLKMSIEPIGMKTVSVFGFPLPIVEFKLPKVDFEFGSSNIN